MCTYIESAYSRATVSVRATAPAICAVSIAGGTAEVLTTTTVVSGGNSCGLGSHRGSGRVVAARQASSSAVTLGGSTPTVLRAACAAVDCAVGIAEQVTVGRATLAVLRVLGLPLFWHNAEVGGRDLGVIALDIGDTLAVLAVLPGQATVGRVDIAGRVDPVKVDVG